MTINRETLSVDTEVKTAGVLQFTHFDQSQTNSVELRQWFRDNFPGQKPVTQVVCDFGILRSAQVARWLHYTRLVDLTMDHCGGEDNLGRYQILGSSMLLAEYQVNRLGQICTPLDQRRLECLVLCQFTELKRDSSEFSVC